MWQLKGQQLTSNPSLSFSFQKQKCVTFLSQNSSGFTTHTSDTSAGITFWKGISGVRLKHPKIQCERYWPHVWDYKSHQKFSNPAEKDHKSPPFVHHLDLAWCWYLCCKSLNIYTCNMSTTVFTVFHWDFRPSTMTVKPRALHFSLPDRAAELGFDEMTDWRRF